MLWGVLIGIALYIVADAFFDVSEKVSAWVRGVAGRARGLVVGSAPARTEKSVRADLKSDSVGYSPHLTPNTPPPPPSPKGGGVNWLSALKSAGLFIWKWRDVLFALLLIWLAWGFLRPVVSFVTCPFGGVFYCFTEKDAAAALENERTNTRVAQHETGVANRATQLSDQTHANVNAARTAARIAQEDIENAVASLPPSPTAADFAELQRRYCAGYGSVLPHSCPGEPDSDPTGPPAVRRAHGDAA